MSRTPFRLPLASEGLPFLLPPALLGAGLILVRGWWILPGAVLLLLAAFVTYFFRDPERTIPEGPGLVVSPADGKVMRVGDAEPSLEAPPGLPQVVTIFLSVLDVHVNRSPASGRIETVAYRPGGFRVAFDEEASRGNERNEVVLEGEEGRLAFRQVAGTLARRIVFRRSEGDEVRRGERVGMIRFGSRADVFLPEGFVVKVEPGQRVRGGETVLAVAAPS